MSNTEHQLKKTNVQVARPDADAATDELAKTATIAVIGASGHVGRHLISALEQDGVEVHPIGRGDDFAPAVRDAERSSIWRVRKQTRRRSNRRRDRASAQDSGIKRRKETSMTTIKDAASEFLSHKRVAVTGVSRKPENHGSNVVYKRLRERGYEVFAVNPNADEVEGDRAYQDLRAIPGGVDAVVIGTRPEIADETMRECAELGIKHVWMHRGPGAGSVSQTATAYGRERGITVIDGGCPCMFDPTADFGHKAMRFMFTLNGNVPKQV
jgi:uncharacterized protein